MTAGPLRLCGRNAGRAVDDGSCGCGDGVVHGCVIAAATVWVPALLWWGAGPAVVIEQAGMDPVALRNTLTSEFNARTRTTQTGAR